MSPRAPRVRGPTSGSGGNRSRTRGHALLHDAVLERRVLSLVHAAHHLALGQRDTTRMALVDADARRIRIARRQLGAAMPLVHTVHASSSTSGGHSEAPVLLPVPSDDAVSSDPVEVSEEELLVLVAVGSGSRSIALASPPSSRTAASSDGAQPSTMLAAANACLTRRAPYRSPALCCAWASADGRAGTTAPACAPPRLGRART